MMTLAKEHKLKLIGTEFGAVGTKESICLTVAQLEVQFKKQEVAQVTFTDKELISWNIEMRMKKIDP